MEIKADMGTDSLMALPLNNHENSILISLY